MSSEVGNEFTHFLFPEINGKWCNVCRVGLACVRLRAQPRRRAATLGQRSGNLNYENQTLALAPKILIASVYICKAAAGVDRARAKYHPWGSESDGLAPARPAMLRRRQAKGAASR